MNDLLECINSPIYGSVFFFIIGAMWGSFFNVCIYRLPIEEDIVVKPSHCPNCKKNIPWYLNLPIISYVLLRGKCKHCQKRISIQYPLIELASGLLFLYLFLKLGITLRFLYYALFLSSLLVISVIDLHHQIIPNEISLPGIVLGFIFSFIFNETNWIESGLGIIIGGGTFFSIAWLYEKYSGKEGLGGGDVKLLAMIGAWLGYQSLLVVIVCSSLLGSIIGIGFMLIKGKNLKAAIPFGPFLALGAYFYIFWGKEINHILFPSFPLE